MVRKIFALGAALVALLVLLWATGAVVAGPPPEGPGGDVSIAATVSSKFSYQGVLKENDSPVTGSRHMTFRLYSDSGCSTQVGSDIVKSGVQVTDGLFSVDLAVTHSDFNGQGLWLEVEVGGTKIGCQEIMPVPYALSLRPGAVVSGTVAGSGLEVRNTATSGTTYGVYGQSDSTAGRGVSGYATATSGTTYGVYGKSDSTNGLGVFGYATATSGSTWGVWGWSDSTLGRGVYGLAYATSGDTRGVYGRSNSDSGKGVYGYASATSGTTIGVYGKSASTDGFGVVGFGPGYSEADWPGIWKPGGFFAGRNGVVGLTKTAGGYGVYGQATATSGWGVYGHATAASGTTYGVYGRSDSPSGAAIYGHGDVKQNLAGNGLVKAAVFARCGGMLGTVVYRYFNNVNANPITIGPDGPRCTINFGFDINDRFWVATAVDNDDRGVTCELGSSNTYLYCVHWYGGTGNDVEGDIMVLVY